mgnify:CR=1 FL=1
MGWECPRCHTTWAPWVPSCSICEALAWSALMITTNSANRAAAVHEFRTHNQA